MISSRRIIKVNANNRLSKEEAQRYVKVFGLKPVMLSTLKNKIWRKIRNVLV